MCAQRAFRVDVGVRRCGGHGTGIALLVFRAFFDVGTCVGRGGGLLGSSLLGGSLLGSRLLGAGLFFFAGLILARIVRHIVEAALGALEGGHAVTFASGMAAVSAVVLGRLRPGDRLVAPGDGYPGIRKLAAERLEPSGIRVQLVPTDTAAVVTAARGAALVWVETPSNPGLDVGDLAAIASAVRAEGGLLGVDNTVATPLGQRPL
ncbi:MAG: PLP-dependent transferase, partial [Proteobacteria bacterium]|nr:PLP-dependent transferase [Pseudomonadota bacterium]